MVASEREMVRQLDEDLLTETTKTERFTSLQPTYEDSVPPDAEDDWDFEA